MKKVRAVTWMKPESEDKPEEAVYFHVRVLIVAKKSRSIDQAQWSKENPEVVYTLTSNHLKSAHCSSTENDPDQQRSYIGRTS